MLVGISEKIILRKSKTILLCRQNELSSLVKRIINCIFEIQKKSLKNKLDQKKFNSEFTSWEISAVLPKDKK